MVCVHVGGGSQLPCTHAPTCLKRLIATKLPASLSMHFQTAPYVPACRNVKGVPHLVTPHIFERRFLISTHAHSVAVRALIGKAYPPPSPRFPTNSNLCEKQERQTISAAAVSRHERGHGRHHHYLRAHACKVPRRPSNIDPTDSSFASRVYRPGWL